MLVSFPHVGRVRNQDLGAGLRSFPVGEYIIIYSVEGPDVFILRVVHGRRDIERLFMQ
jgi:toxin ParE1/3/4